MNISRISTFQSYASLAPNYGARTSTAKLGPSSTFSPSSVASFTSLRSSSPADRDLETQRRLLGEDAFELSPPGSQPATPSPLFHQTSPLSVASHLQDEFDEELLLNDPFVVDSDRSPQLRSFTASYLEPPKSPMRRSVKQPVTTTHDATNSLGLDLHTNSEPIITTKLFTEDVTKSMRAATAPGNLPTIHEGAPLLKRNRYTTTTRPSLFPLGPPPEPLPPRRPRYEPPPHIVDIAVEHLRSQSPNQSPSIPSLSLTPDVEVVPTPRRRSWFPIMKHEEEEEHVIEDPAEKERERQWKVWEMERQRALDMTKEAAKGNRPEWGGTTVEVTPEPVKISSKRFWKFCFGNVTDEQVKGEEAMEETALKSSLRRRR